MKFIEPRPFTDADIAAHKLIEIANGIEAVQDGRIFIEKINAPFLAAGGTGEDFRVAIERAGCPYLYGKRPQCAVKIGWLYHC